MENSNYLLRLQTCTTCDNPKAKRDLDEDVDDEEIMGSMKKRYRKASASSTSTSGTTQSTEEDDHCIFQDDHENESECHEKATDKEESKDEMSDSQSTASPFSDNETKEFVQEADDEVNPNKLHFELQQEIEILEKSTSSSLGLRDAFKMFCCKRFIVNEDYILFPYCVRNAQGMLERPLNTRVSYILQHNGERYIPVKKNLQSLDTMLNADTAILNDPDFIRLRLLFLNEKNLEAKMQKMPDKIREFVETLSPMFEEMTDKKYEESKYRHMLARFIEIVQGNVHIHQACSSSRGNKVHFPLKQAKLQVAARPDILITKQSGGHVVAVVESKKYHQMKKLFEDVPKPHCVRLKEKKEASKLWFQGKHSKEEKEPTKVQFHGILRNASENKVKVPNEKLYKDLDSSLCRYMTEPEKTYLDYFLSQVVGDILACFGEQDKKALQLIIQRPDLPKKVVRYGIGQVGFKVFFVTVGLNGELIGQGKTPYIEIEGVNAHGLDIFCTRPLDLMLAEERSIIADILYALFTSHGV